MYPKVLADELIKLGSYFSNMERDDIDKNLIYAMREGLEARAIEYMKEFTKEDN